MARTKDEVALLLAEKFKKESHRLKSWGTKTDDKAAISFAMSVLDLIRALMCESRYRELKRMLKKCSKEEWFQPADYIKERLKATKAMTTALQNVAVKAESKRPWKSKHHKEKKHHHGHHSHV